MTNNDMTAIIIRGFLIRANAKSISVTSDTDDFSGHWDMVPDDCKAFYKKLGEIIELHYDRKTLLWKNAT